MSPISAGASVKAQQEYQQLLRQAHCAVQRDAQRLVLTEQAFSFEWDGVKVNIAWVHQPQANWVLMQFKLLNFSVCDTGTLTRLLQLNQELSLQTSLASCFALSPEDGALMFIQRVGVGEIPAWALHKYFKDCIERLNSMFVLAVEL